MVDQMVLQTQQWLNKTYKGKVGFGSVPEDGKTGWPTIYGMTRALQIELGITATADNFGPGTQARFSSRWPHGIKQQANGDKSTSNVYAIIQGALWCKGYSTGSDITTHFYGGTGGAVIEMKTDSGMGGDSTVTLEIMMALLSMDQFKLVPGSGTAEIRAIQQTINADYRTYTGLIPADGVYGRQMNTALIQVLQAVEGYSPDDATGNFGAGTRSKLQYIGAGNAAANPSWVWVATAALTCNKCLSSASKAWSGTVGQAVSHFQDEYALPKTGVVDPTTWMSLLTSKGDSDRPCIACDTRFELTDDFIAALKKDGYKIVGRYLSEPGQDGEKPIDYFKAIHPGELERIVAAGMEYFPIFQESSTELGDFTPETGKADVLKAVAAAKRLGVPSTTIYFAVDMDAMDYQVDSNILPYFKAVKANLSGGYDVGIYASRNICRRVMDAGYASGAFVSDMSTGYSGNLGYPIPAGWGFDQFTEIDGYQGKWDIDRVAVSDNANACGSVLFHETETPIGVKPAPAMVASAADGPEGDGLFMPYVNHLNQSIPVTREASWGHYDFPTIATIEPNEAYIVRDIHSDIHDCEVWVAAGNGSIVHGYYAKSTNFGDGTVEKPWSKGQDAFIDWNSDGTALTLSKKVEYRGKEYAVFTLQRPSEWITDIDGKTVRGGFLPQGAQVLLNHDKERAHMGKEHPTHVSCAYWSVEGEGKWIPFLTDSAFVDFGFQYGCMPDSRTLL